MPELGYSARIPAAERPVRATCRGGTGTETTRLPHCSAYCLNRGRPMRVGGTDAPVASRRTRIGRIVGGKACLGGAGAGRPDQWPRPPRLPLPGAAPNPPPGREPGPKRSSCGSSCLRRLSKPMPNQVQDALRSDVPVVGGASGPRGAGVACWPATGPANSAVSNQIARRCPMPAILSIMPRSLSTQRLPPPIPPCDPPGPTPCGDRCW